MANLGFRSGKDELAVENLLSQANDLYVLEQVAAINLCGFTHSSLPTHLETRFRRLKSLPDPVSSSSNKKRNQRNTSSAFSGDEKRALKNQPRIGSRKIGSSSCKFSDAKTYPLDNEAHIVSGNKRNLSVNSRGGALSDSRKIGSSSCRFSRERKIFNPTAHNFPKEIPRFSSSSFTSIDLASPPTSDPNPKEEGSNRKPKSKLSISWFKKLSISPAQAIGCLLWRPPTKSSSNTKKTFETSSNKPLPRRHKETDFGEFSVDEQRKMLKNAKSSVQEQRKMLKNAITESQRMRREAAEIIKTRK